MTPNGGDISLSTAAPIQRGAIAPRLDAVVATKSKPGVILAEGFEPGPTAHSRSNSVGADNPAGGNCLSVSDHSCRGNPGHWRFPQQSDADFAGAFDHPSVKYGAPDANALPGRKVSINLQISIEKANAL